MKAGQRGPRTGEGRERVRTGLEKGPDALENAAEAGAASEDVLDVAVEFVVGPCCRCGLCILRTLGQDENGLAGVEGQRGARYSGRCVGGCEMNEKTHMRMALAVLARVETVATWGSADGGVYE